MELQDKRTAALPLREQLDGYSNLCKRGLYLDALAAAERDCGPLDQWQHTELRILAVKALSHLGLRRSADAIVFRTWRRDRRDPLIVPYYLQAVLGRRGPLGAWELYRQLENTGFPDGVDHAYLLCIEADILSSFRDFAGADRRLQEAGTLDHGNWIKVRRAQLLQEADQHKQALELCERIHRGDPTYIGAAHAYAALLQRNDQSRRALELLQPYWESCQSLTLGRLLCQLATEQRQFDTAHRCLERMERLMERGCPKYLRREQDNLWADYHCARGDYDAALPYLEQKDFYRKRVSESIRHRGGDSQRRILPLPYIQQRHMTCAPASIATVLQFWGQAADQDEIAEAICYNGTSNYDQRAWLLEQGWQLAEFDLNFPQLKRLIDLGIPVLLTTVEPGSAHLQVIAGYDRAMGTYILRDPSHPRLQEMLIEEGERYYAANGPRCMAVVPAAKAPLLEAPELRAAPLYDDTFLLRRELEKHRYGAARPIAERMRARDPRHRLTLHGQLDLAYYTQDDGRILQLTEQLLEQFPQDVNLQLGKIQTLSRLNAARKALDYMETLEKGGEAHFLIRSRLADSLRFDHRNSGRVAKLLSTLLRQNPLHAQTLYQQAGFLWDGGEHERACALYRFVTCLEETNETYAGSYFKAERYLKRTDIALEFLRDRFKRFGDKSAGPAISLFNALDALERAEEGLEVLRNGIARRPEDGELMLFTARRLLYLNRVAEAEQLTDRARPFANRNRHLEVAAEICAHRQQRDEAIALWRKILEREPLNYDACSTVVRLHTELDQYHRAIAFLDQKIEEYPGNYQLQRMRLNWLAEEEVEQIENCCLQLIHSHPDDNWAYLRLAYLCSQRSRPDEALKYALEATRISRTHSEAWAQLGQVYLLRQERTQAVEAFKRAIALSCDCTSAFAPLLQCAHGLEQKKQLLAYIHGELMRQVSYGDGVLSYQGIAREWLPAEELLDFLHLALQQRPDLWHCWLALADGYRNQDDLAQARATLLTAIKRFPLLPRLHLELAEIFRLGGDLLAAEEQLRHTLELNPDWADVHNKLADLLEFQGRYREAIETLEAAIRRIPGDAAPRGYLADLLWRRGERQRALDEVQKCLELAPFYGWAWHKLCQWSRELGNGDTAEKRIAAARHRFPNSALLARVDADFRRDPGEKAEVLAAFAETQPQNIDIACRLIEALCDSGDFERALQHCTTERWNGPVPIEIRARGAWLTRQRGDIPRAIEQIREVAGEAPYFHEAWRLLASWALDSNDRETAREALNQCRALHPNDPGVLTFVAEGLQRLEENGEEILALLARAFELEPSDQYNGLTYLDQLIENRDWPGAREVLELIKLHSEDAFVLTRELQLLAAEERDGEALLQNWSQLLVHEQSNHWVIHTAWEVMAGSKLEKSAGERIEILRREDKAVHPYAGYCLAKYQLKQMSLRKFEKQFQRLKRADAFTQRALECYLDLLARRSEMPSARFAPVLEMLIAADTANWGTYGMLLARRGQWSRAKQWFSNWQQHPEPRAWMLYFASLSHRQCGAYQSGVEIMAAAYRLENDNYRGDIVCLHVLDMLLAGHREAAEVLQHSQLNELDPPARYALALSQVLLALGEGDFIDRFDQLGPRLRDAQYYCQKTGNIEAAQQLKRRVHARLKGTIRLAGLKRLFWIWRLSNHF